MCTVLLPPGVNPIAVHKYINININIKYKYRRKTRIEKLGNNFQLFVHYQTMKF